THAGAVRRRRRDHAARALPRRRRSDRRRALRVARAGRPRLLCRGPGRVRHGGRCIPDGRAMMEVAKNHERYMVPGLERGLKLLSVFSRATPELSLADLARKLA